MQGGIKGAYLLGLLQLLGGLVLYVLGCSCLLLHILLGISRRRQASLCLTLCSQGGCLTSLSRLQLLPCLFSFPELDSAD